MQVVNNKIDFFFIKFPIIFPIIYVSALYLFPNYENFIIILAILILAEPHFGATLPFMIDKKNQEMIRIKKFEFIFIPIFILLLSLLCFFSFKKEFLLFFFIANIYHVTRQSVGIIKLYISELNEKNINTVFIYSYNIILFFVGLFRFYLPIIPGEYLFLLNFLLILMFFLILIICYQKFKNYKNLFILSTGLLIFYPIAFVSNPVHSIIMGVTMHYSQYLLLTFIVGLRRNKQTIKKTNFFYLNNYLIKFFLIVFIYSIIMSFFSLLGKSNNDIFNQLIIIPITFQLLHFYFDGLLWKFSLKDNRENTLKYIFNIKQEQNN